MGTRRRLALLAGVSGTVLTLLGHTAHSATERLLGVPPQSWSLSELSDAVVAGTCAIGTLGALWHVVSALLALMALPGENGHSSVRRGGACALAARILEAWGQTHRRLRTARLPVLGAGTGRRGAHRRGRSGMAPHQLSTRLTTGPVLDAVTSSRPARPEGHRAGGSIPVPARWLHGFTRACPFEHFDRLQRLGQREPVGAVDPAGQLPDTALHHP